MYALLGLSCSVSLLLCVRGTWWWFAGPWTSLGPSSDPPPNCDMFTLYLPPKASASRLDTSYGSTRWSSYTCHREPTPLSNAFAPGGAPLSRMYE